MIKTSAIKMLTYYALNNMGIVPDTVEVPEHILKDANFKLVVLGNGIRVLNGTNYEARELLYQGKVLKLTKDYGFTNHEATKLLNCGHKHLFDNLPLLRIILDNDEMLKLFLSKPMVGNPMMKYKQNVNWKTQWDYSALEANFPPNTYNTFRLNALYDLLVLIRPNHTHTRVKWYKDSNRIPLEQYLALHAIKGSSNHNVMLKRILGFSDNELCWALVGLHQIPDGVYTHVKFLEAFTDLKTAMGYMDRNKAVRILIRDEKQKISDKFIDVAGKTIILNNPSTITVTGEIIKQF